MFERFPPSLYWRHTFSDDSDALVLPDHEQLHCIFFELLPGVGRCIESDLKDLGLEHSHKQYVGTNAYSPGVPYWIRSCGNPQAQNFLCPYLSFLLKHPSRALEVTVLRIGRAGQQPYANYDKRIGFAEYAQTPPSPSGAD